MSTYNHDNHDCRERVILEEYEKLSPDLIFEIIRHDGEEELERKTKPLILSGLAAGIIISFSFYFKAILAMYVGHTLWAEAISGFGYTTGFLMVILGRLQLFTENTITTVLPFMKHPNMENLMKLFRLWAIVLSANFVGTFIAALFLWLPAFAQPGITEALSELSAHIMSVGAIDNIYRGIPAGILIAAIVWMIPMSRGFSFFTVLTFTYFISIGAFSHVVVGSCEAAYDVLVGNSSVADYFFKFLIPTGLGNILGGTGVFTLLVSAQVKAEKNS